MATILLINPSYDPTYGGTKGGITNPVFPTLGLATIAAVARQQGHRVHILDMSWRPYDFSLVQSKIRDIKPDVVGITATTPLMNQVRDLSLLVKDISKDIAVVAGGPHVTALPEETLSESLLDAVFLGEADYSFANYCDGADPVDVKNICYRSGDDFVRTARESLIGNLDDLPMPAWDLYHIKDYHRIPRLLVKRLPAAVAEFSRGCVFQCNFCASKTTLGQGYRKKSPERCAEEVRQMHALGFREFWLADDIFTSDNAWAISVCEAIAKAGVDIVWTCTNGIRVESADERLFQSLRKAGCYRVSFGFESGNNEILEKFGKGGQATIEQGREAVRMARSAGLDTAGTMLLGLSDDTEETMMDTIDYARRLPLDMMKFGITIAFPGTRMFTDYAHQGLIRSFDWDKYFIYTNEPLFAHPNLSHEKVTEYQDIAFKKAILYNPRFIIRRILRGLKTGEFFWDMLYAIKFFALPASRAARESRYYAKGRWPEYDFEGSTMKDTPILVARKRDAHSTTPAVDILASAESRADNLDRTVGV